MHSVTSSDQERSCILLLRLQAAGGEWRWVHCVLQLKDAQETNTTTTTETPSTDIAKKEIEPSNPAEKPSSPALPDSSPLPSHSTSQTSTVGTSSQSSTSQQSVIVATNQVLGEREAMVLRANSWLYHYYSIQSKLQYNLAYEAQRVQAYYPQMMQYQTDASSSYTNHYSHNANQPTSYANSPHSHYSSMSASPYFQHYHSHYPLRLHPGFDYSRTQHSYMNVGDQISSLHSHVHASPPVESYQSHPPQPHEVQHFSAIDPSISLSKTNKKTSPIRPASRRSSPIHGISSNVTESGGVAVATPVAVRPTPPTHNKGVFQQITDDIELTWKASPIQVVPDYTEYTPYVTPPYSKAPSPVKVVGTDSPSPEFADHRVPSVGGLEAAWLTELQTRAPWIPVEEHSASLRMFHQPL